MRHHLILVFANDEVAEGKFALPLLNRNPNIFILLEFQDLWLLAELQMGSRGGGVYTLNNSQNKWIAGAIPFKCLKFFFAEH